MKRNVGMASERVTLSSSMDSPPTSSRVLGRVEAENQTGRQGLNQTEDAAMEESAPNIEELGKKTDRLDVKNQYDLNPEDYDELFNNSHECFMAHISKDGYPIVSPMWYVVIDGMIYLTTIKDLRHKTAALMKNPNMSLILTNFSVAADDVKAALNSQELPTQIIGRYLTPLSRIEHIMAILVKAKAEVTDDRELRARVHRLLIDKYYANESEESRADIVKAVDTPNRVIIKVNPVKVTHWDLGKMVGVR
jgi:general stress protein 26